MVSAERGNAHRAGRGAAPNHALVLEDIREASAVLADYDHQCTGITYGELMSSSGEEHLQKLLSGHFSMTLQTFSNSSGLQREVHPQLMQLQSKHTEQDGRGLEILTHRMLSNIAASPYIY